MAEKYTACEMVVKFAEKIVQKLTTAEYYFNRVLGKFNKIVDAVEDLPPDLPHIKEIDFALLDGIRKECPFIKISFDPAAALNQLLDNARDSAQKSIDDVLEDPLSKIASFQTQVNVAYAKLGFNALIKYLEGIVRCMDKICDAVSAQHWKDQLDEWKTWATGTDEKVGVLQNFGTSMQKQYAAKAEALKEFNEPIPSWEAPPIIQD